MLPVLSARFHIPAWIVVSAWRCPLSPPVGAMIINSPAAVHSNRQSGFA